MHEPACVVISDYGNDYDRCLLPAIEYNITYLKQLGVSCPLFGIGYIWGQPVAKLTACLTGSAALSDDSSNHKFDIVIMADCIFNRSEHKKLLWTVKETLSPTGVALCSFRFATSRFHV